MAAPARGPADANPRGAKWTAQVRQTVGEDGAYLVPLRLFIGLGWLRACAEKVVDPGWRDGSSLTAFLSHHLSSGDIAFPWYEFLVDQVFLPHAALLALLIVLGQLLAGAAIAAGGLTNAALLGGIFMNLNFLLAGAPNPSTFYIVIQVALLLTNAGAILGLDAGLARAIHNPLLVAQPFAQRRRRHRRVQALPMATIALITAVYALAHVTDWSPAGSVEDPAMIAAILALLCLAWATIAWLRQDARGRGGLRRRDTQSRTRKERAQRGAAGIPRPRQVVATTADWLRCGASSVRWSHSPHQPRRLALTVSLTWLDDPHDGGHAEDEQRRGVVPTTAPRTGGLRVPTGS